MVRNSTANAGDVRYAGSIHGSGRSLEENMVTYPSILAWRIPWTKEHGGLQSIELRGNITCMHACNAGDFGLIPGLGRSPGEGNGNLL